MGRSTANIALKMKRDQDILIRFNELYNQKRIRYDYVLFLLKWNYFFINETHLHKILKSQSAQLPRGYKIINTVRHEDMTLIEARNAKLKERFKELYDERQIRIDDAVEVLSREYYIGTDTVNSVLSGYHYYKDAADQLTMNFDE